MDGGGRSIAISGLPLLSPGLLEFGYRTYANDCRISGDCRPGDRGCRGDEDPVCGEVDIANDIRRQ